MTAISSYLGKTLTIQIDRPLGSRHPVHGFIYPLNYGFLPGVLGGDGEELDAYLLGIFEPVEEFTGVCIAIIHRLDDDEDKLVVVPEGKMYTKNQILALTEFQESYFSIEIFSVLDFGGLKQAMGGNLNGPKRRK